MYVCPELELVYLAQPRTASRSVVELLRWNTVVEVRGQHHDVDVSEVVRLRMDEDWTIVTAVRNHYDAIVSWFFHSPFWFGGGTDADAFQRFARMFPEHPNNQYVQPHQMFWKYQSLATDVMRYEDQWVQLSNLTGLELDEIPVLGKSDRKPYRDYYDEQTRAFIGDYYREELDLYGYEF